MFGKWFKNDLKFEVKVLKEELREVKDMLRKESSIVSDLQKVMCFMRENHNGLLVIPLDSHIQVLTLNKFGFSLDSEIIPCTKLYERKFGDSSFSLEVKYPKDLTKDCKFLIKSIESFYGATIEKKYRYYKVDKDFISNWYFTEIDEEEFNNCKENE
jgi:hypothetical protein